MELFVVGTWRSGEANELNSVWDIQGVFDSEQLAIEACNENPRCFIGPMILNKVLPAETVEWEGCYYPFASKESA